MMERASFDDAQCVETQRFYEVKRRPRSKHRNSRQLFRPSRTIQRRAHPKIVPRFSHDI